MIDKPAVEKKFYTRMMDAYRRRAIHVPFVNPCIRTILRTKAVFEFGRVAKLGAADSEAIRKWYGDHRFFFGFAVPRSGTTFLANFLNSVVERDIVQHEPNINDYYYQSLAIQSDAAALDYIDKYRLPEIYYRLQGYSFDSYGEINPFLRRHCKALMRSLPGVKVFHLVRNGKSVLRSMMSRELFAANDPMAKLIRPAPDDPYSAGWNARPRFEKLCWMWQEDNRFMRETVGHTVKFESILSDYDYFHGELLQHVGLSVDRKDWAAHTAKINNRTPMYRMPTFEGWQPSEQEAFERICGAEMATNGYSV